MSAPRATLRRVLAQCATLLARGARLLTRGARLVLIGVAAFLLLMVGLAVFVESCLWLQNAIFARCLKHDPSDPGFASLVSLVGTVPFALAVPIVGLAVLDRGWERREARKKLRAGQDRAARDMASRRPTLLAALRDGSHAAISSAPRCDAAGAVEVLRSARGRGPTRRRALVRGELKLECCEVPSATGAPPFFVGRILGPQRPLLWIEVHRERDELQADDVADAWRRSSLAPEVAELECTLLVSLLDAGVVPVVVRSEPGEPRWLHAAWCSELHGQVSDLRAVHVLVDLDHGRGLFLSEWSRSWH